MSDSLTNAFQLKDIYEVWKQPDGTLQALVVHFAGIVKEGNDYSVQFLEHMGDSKDHDFYPPIGKKSDDFCGYFRKDELGDNIKFYKFEGKDA